MHARSINRLKVKNPNRSRAAGHFLIPKMGIQLPLQSRGVLTHLSGINCKAALERDTIIKLIIALFVIGFTIWLIAKSGATSFEWFE